MTLHQTKRLPFAPLVSRRRMEALLHTDRAKLQDIADHAGRFYNPFDVLQGGKWRHIDNPQETLKTLQSRVYRAILADCTFRPNVIGGIPGRSILDNVQPHVGKPMIVTLDIRRCFPSIHDLQVYNALRATLYFSSEVASVLTKLTTFQHRLPQGAPSSCIIANLVMVPLHEELERIARAFDLSWTIYIDDVTISGARAREAIAPVIRAIQRQGFAVSHQKIHVMTRASQQRITGVIVNRTRSAGRRYRIEPIRRTILQLQSSADVTESEIRSTMGKVRYVTWVNERQGAKLQRLAEAVVPEPTSSGSLPRQRSDWRQCKSFARDHSI